MSSPPRLFVTIAAPLYREALLQYLLQQDDWDLCGECSQGLPTLDALPGCQASLLLIEESLPDQDGLSIAEEALLQDPRLSVLLLVDQYIPERRLRLYLQAGIRSVISKTQSLQALQRALLCISQGQLYVDPAVCTPPRDAVQTLPWQSLSQREQQVARFLAQRLEAKQIAERMGLSYKTVHSYKDRILQKLGLERPSELLLILQRQKQEWDL